MAALVKETGWKIEYIIWEMPCAYLFILLDFWPTVKLDKNKEEKDVSEFDDLSSLGMDYKAS